MKKNTSVPYLILLLILLFMIGVSKAMAGNILSGEIKGVEKTSLQLILEEDVNRKIRIVIAEVLVDERGQFRLEKDLAPHIYSLRLNDAVSVMLAIEKGQHIVIKGDVADAASLQVSGSEDTRKLQAYERFRKESLHRLVTTVRNQIKELIEKNTPENDPELVELTGLELSNYEKHKEELIEYIKTEMGTSIAIYPTSLRWSGGSNLSCLKELVQRFEAAHPITPIAVKLREKVNVLQANSIGGKVMDIKMPDKDNNIVSLNTLAAKFILIDFWASWCLPCRRESVLLGELYQKFKPQGFEIYGVGFDVSKETWLKAIERDKRDWVNVSTFREFKMPVSFDYSVTSLPTNVLIDGSGKVIARNLHGNELKEVIEKLFLQDNSADVGVSEKLIELFIQKENSK